MPTKKKSDAVAALRDHLERATITMSIGYRGLLVQEMDQLRRQLRESETEVKVIKNRLLALAAEQAGQPDLTNVVDGPTALAFSYGEPLAAAKALTEYASTAPDALSIQGAYMDGQPLSSADIKELVKLPPKPILIGKISGQVQSPMANLISIIDTPVQQLSLLMQSTLSQLPNLIDARACQLESESS